MDVTAMIPPAKSAVGPMSPMYLIFAGLLVWALLATQAQAAVVIAEPQSTLEIGSRTVRLQVAVSSPVDGPQLKRLTYLWNSNMPVTFSSTNGTTRGNTLVATLPKVGSYRFSVLVQDPETFESVSGTARVLDVPAVSTNIKVVESYSQSSFSSVFSPDVDSSSLVFQATMLDQFGASVAANVVDSDGKFWSSTTTSAVMWTLSWTASLNESDEGNASFSDIDGDTGLFSVGVGEGVHSYTILATMIPDDPDRVITNNIYGTATAQTNQVRILFKPAQAVGVPGYLYDHGTQRTVKVGDTIQWGWNIAGIDTEAMRSREGSPISTDQTGRCFALMQMKTYLRVQASLDPDHPTDPATVGMLNRDVNGHAQVDQDLSAATWTLWNLPAANYTIQVRAGDPFYYGRTVDLKLASGDNSTRITGGPTSKNSPWITESADLTVQPGAPLVISNDVMAVRNLINVITIKKSTIPN